MTATRQATEPSQASDVELEVSSAEPLTPELIARIVEFCQEAEDEKYGGAVVIRLTAFDRDRTEESGLHWPGAVTSAAVNRWERALRRLERLPIATVAVAEGECRGAALELLLATDYRLGDREGRIGFPSIADRPWPGMALYRLTHQVGVGRARGPVLFGTDLPMERALEWGLVDELFESEGTAAAARLADRLRSEDGRELAVRRRLMLDAAVTSYENALGAHLAGSDRTLRREDLSDGSSR